MHSCSQTLALQYGQETGFPILCRPSTTSTPSTLLCKKRLLAILVCLTGKRRLAEVGMAAAAVVQCLYKNKKKKKRWVSSWLVASQGKKGKVRKGKKDYYLNGSSSPANSRNCRLKSLCCLRVSERVCRSSSLKSSDRHQCAIG